MMGCVAEHRIFAHPARRQGKAGAITNAAKGRNCLPPFALGKATPDLGLGALRLEVVHIDAVLGQQRQHVLCGADQFRGRPVFQRQPQGAEPGLVVRRFGKIQGADEIRHRKRGAKVFGGCTKGKGLLFAAGPCQRCGQCRLAVRRGHRLRRIAARRECGQRGFRLALCRGDLVQFLFHHGFQAACAGLIMGNEGIAHRVHSGLQARRLVPQGPDRPRHRHGHPKQGDGKQHDQTGHHQAQVTAFDRMEEEINRSDGDPGQADDDCGQFGTGRTLSCRHEGFGLIVLLSIRHRYVPILGSATLLHVSYTNRTLITS